MNVNILKVAEKQAEKKYTSEFWRKFHTKRYYIQRAFLTWFGDIKIYKSPLWLNFGATSYMVKGDDFRYISNVIKEGDILLRAYIHYLDGIFIPGFYSHAAYYSGKTVKSPQTVTHSMAEGVFDEDLFTFLRCDYVIILRPYLDEDEIKIVTERIRGQLGAPYDFDFNFSDMKKFSCTELVYYGFQPFKDKLDLKLIKRLGKKTLAPDDILNMKARLIYVSKYNQKKVKKLLESKGNPNVQF